MKAVMYGAGNIGRGFVGQIFAQSGYELTFIDVCEKVINAINHEGRYPVKILSDDETEDIWIEGVTAIDGRNEEETSTAIAAADIMATAVGVRALSIIAPVIAAGLRKRFTCRTIKPLNVIICENLVDADKELEKFIKAHLNEEEQKTFDECVGLVEASIGRMVPFQTEKMQNGNFLRVCVEAYGFLPVDKAAFKGKIPSLSGICPFDNFDFYIKRKLFIHNLGHAIFAYFGMIRGDMYIYETVGNGSILYIAHNAMMESAIALSAKYDASLPDLHYHITDLLRRFSNKALGDTCARVGGDTVRKLGNKDRLIGALLCSAGEDVTPAFISAGATAAIYWHLKEIGAAQNLQTAQTVLKEVSGLGENSNEAEMILSFYSILSFSERTGFDEAVGSIITAASKMRQKPGII